MLRICLTFSVLTCGLLATVTAAADPAGGATPATTSDPETAPQPDASAEVAPVTAMPSPSPTATDAPAAPAAPASARPSARGTSMIAEPPRAGEAAQMGQPAEREWCGIPMLIADGIYLGMIGVGRVAKSDELVIIGAAGGITNGLLFHTYIYGNGDFPSLGKGLLSVAMRGALAGGGCALGSGCSELSDPALVRLSIGIALGAALDSALLAYRPRRVSSGPSLRLVPAVSQQAFGGSLVGRF